MKLLADECVARAIVGRLRADGHDVEWIDETAKSAMDIPVLNRATSLHVPLLTEDLDFGRYIFGGTHIPPAEGGIQFRLGRLSLVQRVEVISRFFQQHEPIDLAGYFVTIDDADSYRFKPFP